MEPDLTREGGSIPVTLTFQEATGKNVMLLPMGAADDGAHSQNEKIDKRNYIEGTKVMAAYIYEVARLWTAAWFEKILYNLHSPGELNWIIETCRWTLVSTIEFYWPDAGSNVLNLVQWIWRVGRLERAPE